MELAHPLPSDGQLVDAARRGSALAWTELEQRHGSAVVAVAKARHMRAARRTAQQAMDRVRHSVVDGAPPADGAAAIRAIRPKAIAELTGGGYGPDAPDGSDSDAPDAGAPDASDLDARALAEGFGRLPEPWQTVLWHGVVDQLAAAEMTPLLGRGVNEVIALQHTATSGLHQAYLGVVAEDDGAGLAEDCRGIVPLLGAAVRGTLAAHDQRLVDAHLASGRAGRPCTDCRNRLDVFGTIDERLPAAVVPGVAGLSVSRYREVVGNRTRAFGRDALLAERADRVRTMAIAGVAIAVFVAVVAAVLLIGGSDDTAPSASAPVTSAGGPRSTDDPVDSTVDPTVAPSSSTSPSTTSATTEPAAPTTTELVLRPPPTGPANTVQLAFGPGARALGLTAPELDLDVGLSAPAPVLAGGTGTVDVELRNRAASSAVVNFEIRTPDGLLLDALADGDAECRGPSEVAAFCNVSLGAGETKVLALRFRLENSVVGRLIVDPDVDGEELEVGIVATRRLVHSSVGHGEVVMIGNTVMTCADAAPDCSGARELRGAVVNRWDLPMQYVGAVPALGWRNSSAAVLELPEGADVEAAYLFWSGDLAERGQEIRSGGAPDRVSMLPPGAELPVDIAADRVVRGDVDATQYMGYADVTELVAAGGAGDYLVGNVDAVEVQGSYAGWSMVVVTADDTEPRRQHLVTSPFAWFAPDFDHSVGLPVPFGSDRPAQLDLLAFEGEPGFLPEMLTAGGRQLGGDNEFDGSISGPRSPSYVNSFGIDIEAYDLVIDAPDGFLSFDATSDKDGVRLAVYGLTVDLES